MEWFNPQPFRCCPVTLGKSFTHVTRAYVHQAVEIGTGQGQWRLEAGKETVGLAESNGSHCWVCK